MLYHYPKVRAIKMLWKITSLWPGLIHINILGSFEQCNYQWTESFLYHGVGLLLLKHFNEIELLYCIHSASWWLNIFNRGGQKMNTFDGKICAWSESQDRIYWPYGLVGWINKKEIFIYPGWSGSWIQVDPIFVQFAC